jgi:3'-5' exoribonuclease
MDDLNYLRGLAAEHKTVALADEVLECPSFRAWTASSTPGRHHHGDGGLLTHTAEVVRISQAMLTALPGVRYGDDRLLFLAALFHDYAKTREYVKNEAGVWVNAPFRQEIGHVVGSAMTWDLVAREHHFPDDARMLVTHLILAHHGRKDWGSPVEPAHRLAWVLHLADMASARWCDNGEGKK